DNDISHELHAPIIRSKEKLSDISNQQVKQIENNSATTNLKYAAKKQAKKKVESNNDEAEDNIDVESEQLEADVSTSFELSAPITQSKKAFEKLLDISNQLLMQVQQSGNNSDIKVTKGTKADLAQRIRDHSSVKNHTRSEQTEKPKRDIYIDDEEDSLASLEYPNKVNDVNEVHGDDFQIQTLRELVQK
ncbi:13167_t:CDS:2, partial [Racocetra fulgida]